MLTYVIHPPDKRVETFDEQGNIVTAFELDKKIFLDVSGSHEKNDILGVPW